MLKNNFIALFVHIFFGGVVLLYINITRSMPIDPSIFYFVMSFIFLWLYFWMGKRLQLQGSKLKNLASVSLVAIIGIILSILEDLIGHSKFGGNYVYEYSYYYLSPFGIVLFLSSFMSDEVKRNMLIHISYMFTPTLLLWLGLEWKAKKSLKIN